MQEKSENRIPKDTEDRLNLLLENLERYPSKTKHDLLTRMEQIMPLVYSIKSYDLLNCLYRVVALESLFTQVIKFKNEYANDDEDLNHRLIIMAGLLLINLRASMQLSVGKKIPHNLPEIIVNNVGLEGLEKKLETRFKELFDFYLIRTGEKDPTSQRSSLNFFINMAKQKIVESNTQNSAGLSSHYH